MRLILCLLCFSRQQVKKVPEQKPQVGKSMNLLVLAPKHNRKWLDEAQNWNRAEGSRVCIVRGRDSCSSRYMQPVFPIREIHERDAHP